LVLRERCGVLPTMRYSITDLDGSLRFVDTRERRNPWTLFHNCPHSMLSAIQLVNVSFSLAISMHIPILHQQLRTQRKFISWWNDENLYEVAPSPMFTITGFIRKKVEQGEVSWNRVLSYTSEKKIAWYIQCYTVLPAKKRSSQTP